MVKRRRYWSYCWKIRSWINWLISHQRIFFQIIRLCPLIQL